MNCTFCRILRNELPASRVVEGTLTAAFLDIHPVSPGHVLIVPRRHVESFVDLSPEEASELFTTGQLLATHMKNTLETCEGITVSLADGVSAGQEVPHAHLHLIPRASGDGFGWRFPPNYSSEAAPRDILDSVAARIKASLDRLEKS
jgi:diadenosine tetraphosphate (Ap4A) HIT family hydrolase